jgi:hypothetical protein
MRLLLYTPVSDGFGGQLHRMVAELISLNDVEVYRNIENLSNRLRQCAHDLSIAVLHMARKEDLSDILSIRDLLRDVRIILLLPDRDEETLAQGHILRPRFVSYADSDLADVRAVLDRML